MDLVTLLATCAPLLDSCVGGGIATFRALRLVSKEAGQVVLNTTLRGFMVKLRGEAGDTKEGVASSLMMHTRLQDLALHLRVSDAFNPTARLEHFVHEMRAALKTVSSINVRLDDMRCSNNYKVVNCHALTLLLESCPALKRLCTQGDLSKQFLIRLGKACPLLSTLTILVEPRDNDNLKDVVQLLPSLLPQITSLVLEDNRIFWYDFPDMSSITNVLVLDLPTFGFDEEAQWLSLPCNLKHLSCLGMIRGPPAAETDRRVLCHSLVSMKLVSHYVMLIPLAQLLRAAPGLKVFEAGCESSIIKPKIRCHLDTTPDAATAADLLLLLQHMGIAGIKHATYEFVLSRMERQGQITLSTMIAALPCMTGVTCCSFVDTVCGDLKVMLRLFPDVKSLVLNSKNDVDDVELQALVDCAPQLTNLKMIECHSVRIEGLIKICKIHPSLRHLNLLCCFHLKPSRNVGFRFFGVDVEA